MRATDSQLLLLPVAVCMQVCTEFMGQEQPYFPASASSMFWDQGPFDWEAILQHCRAAWGVQPSKTWMVQQHGGLDWRYDDNDVSGTCRSHDFFMQPHFDP
jgi:hypothetical protein